ncbi:hypothetical protein MF545_07055 [Stenotrophomonas maltophilia]|nr:hypothetical protein [Stenotrophomonas maltophilia]
MDETVYDAAWRAYKAAPRAVANGPSRSAVRAAVDAVLAVCQPAQGWVVADGQGTRWRKWGDFGPEWTTDRGAALHFARRSDAEAFSKEDEDAWLIQPIVMPTKALDRHHCVPPMWLSEQIGGPLDDLTPGQAWRDGFNECRTRSLRLIEQELTEAGREEGAVDAP